MAIFTRKKFRSCFVSRQGVNHVRNEDYGYQNDKRLVYAVADGIGGLPGGNKASEIAVHRFMKEAEKLSAAPKPWSTRQVKAIFESINQAVLTFGLEHRDLRGLGTTFSGLLAEKDDQWWLLHAGDSRIYGVRPSGVAQFTTDQTLHTERRQMGLPIDAGHDSSAHILTNYVGSPTFEPTVAVLRPLDYEAIILCTDGLCKTADPKSMGNLFDRTTGLKQRCQQLVARALTAGSRDDISVIIIQPEAHA